jgi:hypothetical protein
MRPCFVRVQHERYLATVLITLLVAEMNCCKAIDYRVVRLVGHQPPRSRGSEEILATLACKHKIPVGSDGNPNAQPEREDFAMGIEAF